MGTNCFLKGSQQVLQSVMEHVHEEGLQDRVEVAASFCFENCEHGPTVEVDGHRACHCTAEGAIKAVHQALEATPPLA